jgi:hypothetical protein
MNEKLEYLLKTKAYSELTEVELREFAGLCDSREEYENMQLFFSQLDNYKTKQTYETHYMTKGSLDEVFKAKYQKVGFLVKLFPPNKPFYLYPIVQIAALVVIAFLIFEFISSDTDKQSLIAQVENVQKKNIPTQKKQKTENKAANIYNETTEQTKKNYSEPKESIRTQAISMEIKSNSVNNNESDTKLQSDSFAAIVDEENTESSSSFFGTPTSANMKSVSSIAQTNASQSNFFPQEDMSTFSTPKNLKNKKENSTVQPSLFDLLTAVY